MAYAAFRRHRGAWIPVAIGLGIVIGLGSSLWMHDAAIASEPESTLSDTDALRSPGRPPVKEQGLRSPWAARPQPYSTPAIARRPTVELSAPKPPAQHATQPLPVQRNLPSLPDASLGRVEPVHDSLMPDQTDAAFRPRLSTSTVQRLPQNDPPAEPPPNSPSPVQVLPIQSPVAEPSGTVRTAEQPLVEVEDMPVQPAEPVAQQPVAETTPAEQPTVQQPESPQHPLVQDEQAQGPADEERSEEHPMESMFLHEQRPIPAPLIREIRPWGSEAKTDQPEAQPQRQQEPHQEQPQSQQEQLPQEQPNEDTPRQELPQEAAQPHISRPEPTPPETSRSKSASKEEPDWFKNLPSSETVGQGMPVLETAGAETELPPSDLEPKPEAPEPPEIAAVRQTKERVERLPYVLRLTVEKTPAVSLRPLQNEPQAESIPLRTPLMPGPGEFDGQALPSNFELPPSGSASSAQADSESPPEPPGEAVIVSDGETPAEEEPGEPLPDASQETEPKPLASMAEQGDGSRPRRFALIDSAESETSCQPTWGALRAFNMFSKPPRNP